MLKRIVNSIEFQTTTAGLIGFALGEFIFLLLIGNELPVISGGNIQSILFSFFLLFVFSFPFGLAGGFILAKVLKFELVKDKFSKKNAIFKGSLTGSFLSLSLMVSGAIFTQFMVSSRSFVFYAIPAVLLGGIISGFISWYLVSKKFPDGAGIDKAAVLYKNLVSSELILSGVGYAFILNILISILVSFVFLFFFSGFQPQPADWYFTYPSMVSMNKLNHFWNLSLEVFICFYFPQLISTLLLAFTYRWRLSLWLRVLFLLLTAGLAAYWGGNILTTFIKFDSEPLVLRHFEFSYVLSVLLGFLLLGFLLNRRRNRFSAESL